MWGKSGEQVEPMLLGSRPELDSKLPLGLARNGLDSPRPCRKENLFVLFSGLVPLKKSHDSRHWGCPTPAVSVSPAWDRVVWWSLGSCLMVISQTAWFSLPVILNGANGHLRFRFRCCLEPSCAREGAVPQPCVYSHLRHMLEPWGWTPMPPVWCGPDQASKCLLILPCPRQPEQGLQ